jgi:hypothetical protein
MKKRLSDLEFADIIKITIALAIVAVVSVAGFFFKDSLREQFLIPIYKLGWSVKLSIESLPQIILWELLVVLGFAVAVRSLYRGEEGTQQDDIRREEKAESAIKAELAKVRGRKGAQHARTTSRTSRYQIWSRATQKLDFHPLSTGTYDLRRLILEVLAYQSSVTPEEIEAQVVHGLVELPEEIKSFILDRQILTEKQKFTLIDWLKELFQPFNRAVRKLTRRRAVHSTVVPNELEKHPLPDRLRSRNEQQLVAIIQYLEQQLEVDHDT